MQKMLARLGAIVMLVGIMGALVGVFGYLLPKNAGDRLANAIRAANVTELEAVLCDNATLQDVLGVLRQGGDQVALLLGQLLGTSIVGLDTSALASWEVVAQYDIFSSAYTWQYRIPANSFGILGGQVQTDILTPAIQISIRRDNPLVPCVIAS